MLTKQNTGTITSQTDVFIVTYRHDLQWVQWAIAFIHKNLSGFRQIVAVAPEQDRHLFEKIPGVAWNFIPDWKDKGYYWQQWVKIQAPVYTDAEFILYIDSDTMVLEPCHVQDLFDEDGKPYWVFEPYSAVGNAKCWKPITEALMRQPAPYEFMRRFPFLLHRHTADQLEAYLVQLHGQSLEYLVRTSPAVLGGLSEFNALGHYAFEIDKRQRYNWVSPSQLPEKARVVKQFWSHTPMDQVDPQLVEEMGTSIPMLTDFGVWVIPTDTHLSKWICEHRRLDFDTHFLERICQHIPKHGVVIDGGAFVGDHSLAYAMMTSGLPGEVHAFEPNPLAFECLKRNMASYNHVHCHQVGLSDTRTTGMIVPDPNYGGVRLVQGEGSTPLICIDDLELERVDLIKLDVEGFEVRALRGGIGTIHRCKPVIVLEVNLGALEKAGTSREELEKLIDSLGYKILDEIVGLQCDITCVPR